MSETSSSKPDLDDSTNVMADAAAANRENHMTTEGAEPISLWVILGSAIIVLIGGGVLFGGGIFEYDAFVKQGYVREKPADDGNKAAASKPAIDAYMKVGSKLYGSCAGCHQPDGAGNSAYPPLSNSEWVNENSLGTAMIILNGIKGPITVDGKQYNAEMPPQGSGMDAKTLAGVLNYIRNSFGNKSDLLITKEMAQEAIDLSKERGAGQVTADEVKSKYNRDLKGEKLDPKTPVDPVTLEPITAEAK